MTKDDRISVTNTVYCNMHGNTKILLIPVRINFACYSTI